MILIKNNIYIAPLFEDRYKCMFEYDLYGEYEHFCVNLKAIPTCDAVSLPSEILIGVKVYNMKEELLHAESIWLYFSEEEPPFVMATISKAAITTSTTPPITAPNTVLFSISLLKSM